MSVAFFDLDRTVIDLNSGLPWARSEWRLGYISSTQLMRASWWLFKYHLGWSALEDSLRHAIYLLRDQRVSDFEQRVAEFYHTIVAHRVRPEAYEAINAHKARGDEVVLLTTSSQQLSEHFRRDLSLDAVLANRFEMKDGLFTGLPDGPLCFGAGKLNAAIRYLERYDITLEECSFYTDSYADLPLLEEIGMPRIVCPDRKLKAHARRCDWPILNWSLHTPTSSTHLPT